MYVYIYTYVQVTWSDAPSMPGRRPLCNQQKKHGDVADMHACMHACMYVCMYVCKSVCVGYLCNTLM